MDMTNINFRNKKTKVNLNKNEITVKKLTIDEFKNLYWPGK
jgi:hypothetical protein